MDMIGFVICVILYISLILILKHTVRFTSIPLLAKTVCL